MMHFPSCNMGALVGHWHRATHCWVQNVTRFEQVAVHELPHAFHTCPPVHSDDGDGVDVTLQVSAVTH